MSWVSIIEDNLKRLDGTFASLRKEGSANELITRCETLLRDIRIGVAEAKAMAEELTLPDLQRQVARLTNQIEELDRKKRNLEIQNANLNKKMAAIETSLVVEKEKVRDAVAEVKKGRAEVRSLNKTIQKLSAEKSRAQDKNKKSQLSETAQNWFREKLPCPKCGENLMKLLVLPHFRECRNR